MAFRFRERLELGLSKKIRVGRLVEQQKITNLYVCLSKLSNWYLHVIFTLLETKDSLRTLRAVRRIVRKSVLCPEICPEACPEVCPGACPRLPAVVFFSSVLVRQGRSRDAVCLSRLFPKIVAHTAFLLNVFSPLMSCRRPTNVPLMSNILSHFLQNFLRNLFHVFRRFCSSSCFSCPLVCPLVSHANSFAPLVPISLCLSVRVSFGLAILFPVIPPSLSQPPFPNPKHQYSG